MALVGHGLRVVGWLALFVALLLTGPLLTLAFGNVSMRGDWRTATHRATGLAPDPRTHPTAVVQIYASRTFGWRGAFAVHTWIAAKPANADRYTRYEVIGWYARGGGTGLTISDSGAGISSSVPSCSSMIFFTIGSPRPVPLTRWVT